MKISRFNNKTLHMERVIRNLELNSCNNSLFSSLRTWSLSLSIFGFLSAASFVWFRIALNASPGKWTVEGHRGYAWTDIAEGLLIVLFLASVVSLLLFSLKMGKLVNKVSDSDEPGELIRISVVRLRDHFKFMGITFILIIFAVLYGIISSDFSGLLK